MREMFEFYWCPFDNCKFPDKSIDNLCPCGDCEYLIDEVSDLENSIG